MKEKNTLEWLKLILARELIKRIVLAVNVHDPVLHNALPLVLGAVHFFVQAQHHVGQLLVGLLVVVTVVQVAVDGVAVIVLLFVLQFLFVLVLIVVVVATVVLWQTCA
ncbi:hypothetical protein BC828DRAFT_392824 [Blastocladiella britannica]|nr:hypothetical protein BC828DRAFT_392824 [Blastocladiella britannica]